MNADIVILSTNDWNGFWFQRQEFACRFAAEGRRVFFINRIPQRVPHPGRLFRWLLSKRQVSVIRNVVPPGVRVLSPRLLPPFALMRPFNRFLWRRFWDRIAPLERPLSPVMISYQPTYNVVDLIPIIGAIRVVYVNTHNYDADPSCPKSLLAAEAELVRRADALMADSTFNAKRLERYGPTVLVGRAMPGVDVAWFGSAYRGDEASRRRTVFFFGDIGRHLDIGVYNALAERWVVILLGIVDPAVSGQISGRIRLLPPVHPRDLPKTLTEADILTIFYKPSAYANGILPAKFFECVATGKPLLVSGLPETVRYPEAVYDIGGDADKASAIIDGLEETETEARRAARAMIAAGADWAERCRQFKEQAGIL